MLGIGWFDSGGFGVGWGGYVGWLAFIFKYLLGGWFGWGCCLFMKYVPLFQTCVCFLEKRAPGGCVGYIGEMILPSYMGIIS